MCPVPASGKRGHMAPASVAVTGRSKQHAARVSTSGSAREQCAPTEDSFHPLISDVTVGPSHPRAPSQLLRDNSRHVEGASQLARHLPIDYNVRSCQVPMEGGKLTPNVILQAGTLRFGRERDPPKVADRARHSWSLTPPLGPSQPLPLVEQERQHMVCPDERRE